MNPKKSPEEKMKGIGLSLPPDIHAAAKRMAAKKIQSFSAFVRDLIVEECQKAQDAGVEKKESGNRKIKKAVKNFKKATGQ